MLTLQHETFQHEAFRRTPQTIQDCLRLGGEGIERSGTQVYRGVREERREAKTDCDIEEEITRRAGPPGASTLDGP